MLEWFICPDNVTIPVKECLACTTKCRCGNVCLTQPTRKEIAREREWNGIPSTTQLLNGTMYEFLKLTQPYAVDPDKRMFALEGTHHHTNLESMAKELNLPSELPLSIDRDIFDLLEQEDDGWVLTDYKLWGSYKVAKGLGLVEIGKKPDPSGELYKISGKWGKAGTPKMVPVFQSVESEVDLKEQELQLNRYRVMLYELGVSVVRMQLQVTVRDGGLGIATSRGLDRNSYMIPVRKLDDNKVLEYFDQKSAKLKWALDGGSTEPCSNEECWDGTRCRDYCEVAIHCSKGLLYKRG